MKLKPLAGYVLVETLPDEDKTESGLYTPESMKDKPARGKVLAVGPPVDIEAPLIQPVPTGAIIVFKRWGGQDIKEGDKELKLVKVDEIMGVYE